MMRHRIGTWTVAALGGGLSREGAANLTRAVRAASAADGWPAVVHSVQSTGHWAPAASQLEVGCAGPIRWAQLQVPG